MGVEGISAASEGDDTQTETKEREDPVAAHERRQKEKDEARRARSERLGHEISAESKEVKKTSKKKAAEPETTE